MIENLSSIDKMNIFTGNRKRKRTMPRFCSSKHLKQTKTTEPTELLNQGSDASFEAFPREIFCNIVSYIGPTSSSLCIIGRLSRYHREMMNTIGDVMLERAKLRFRTPLPPESHSESSISLFVRHSRVAKVVHDNLEMLESVLEKEFPVTDISITNGYLKNYDPPHNSPDTVVPRRMIVVEPHELENALNVALCLLGAGREHYFCDVEQALHISKNAATTALEWRVSSICGKLGAKAYKYFKARILSSNEQETDEMFSSFTVSDEFNIEHGHLDDDIEDKQDFHFETYQPDEAQDMKRLEKSCFVMQLVVLRDIENASEIRYAPNDGEGGGHGYETWLREQQT